MKDGLMGWVVERADKNSKVYAIQPTCSECGTRQVQIMDVDRQEWRCRKCGLEFTTEVVV